MNKHAITTDKYILHPLKFTQTHPLRMTKARAMLLHRSKFDEHKDHLSTLMRKAVCAGRGNHKSRLGHSGSPCKDTVDKCDRWKGLEKSDEPAI